MAGRDQVEVDDMLMELGWAGDLEESVVYTYIVKISKKETQLLKKILLI